MASGERVEFMDDEQLRQAERTLHNAVTRLEHAAGLLPDAEAESVRDAAATANAERVSLSVERRRRENEQLDEYAES